MLKNKEKRLRDGGISQLMSQIYHCLWSDVQPQSVWSVVAYIVYVDTTRNDNALWTMVSDVLTLMQLYVLPSYRWYDQSLFERMIGYSTYFLCMQHEFHWLLCGHTQRIFPREMNGGAESWCKRAHLFLLGVLAHVWCLVRA